MEIYKSRIYVTGGAISHLMSKWWLDWL